MCLAFDVSVLGFSAYVVIGRTVALFMFYFVSFLIYLFLQTTSFAAIFVLPTILLVFSFHLLPTFVCFFMLPFLFLRHMPLSGVRLPCMFFILSPFSYICFSRQDPSQNQLLLLRFLFCQLFFNIQLSAFNILTVKSI